MFACMVMSYSLLLFNYTASVVFTSAYVLLMLHLLAPGGMRLIGERAIDTAVGCAIAIAASHLFPYWEYRLMGKQVRDMIGAMRNYLEASWWWTGKPSAQAEAKSTADANLFADANAGTAQAATAALARAEAGETELATSGEYCPQPGKWRRHTAFTRRERPGNRFWQRQRYRTEATQQTSRTTR